MSLPRAGGYPSLAGTTTPRPIWATKLLVKFYENTVLGAITNTDYEGDISNMGDQVRIRTTPDITIRNYSIGQVLQNETPQPGIIDLDIDRPLALWNVQLSILVSCHDANELVDFVKIFFEVLFIEIRVLQFR